MENRNILISGAGVAGLTLAYWLKRHGFSPTLVEIASEPGAGGNMVDFSGAGNDVALRMGILPSLQELDSKMNEIAFVSGKPKNTECFKVAALRNQLPGPVCSVLRGDLVRVIFNAIKSDVEFIFGDSIQSIEQSNRSVQVRLLDGIVRSYDLVIGADGPHSNVRKLEFGDEARFERYFGYYKATFTLEKFHGLEKPFMYHTTVGRQVEVRTLPDGRVAVLLVFRNKQKLRYALDDVVRQKQWVREAFGGVGWQVPALLERMETTRDFAFDSVSQIRMKEWSKGRVSLVGDACERPSLLSGHGAALAMAGAYVLAGELKASNGKYFSAFQMYRQVFRSVVEEKHGLAEKRAPYFIPKSRLGIWLRNCFSKLLFIPWIVRQYRSERFVLKSY